MIKLCNKLRQKSWQINKECDINTILHNNTYLPSTYIQWTPPSSRPSVHYTGTSRKGY